MPLPANDYSNHFTWTDYRSWSEEERWEILDGEAFAMAASPNIRHQRIGGELFRQMANHFRGKTCEVFNAPLDVKLSEENVVEPDILVVCDPDQYKTTHVEGPPTLVVEVLSPSSASKDRVRKIEIYARFGVKEYWLVTPWPASVEVLILKDGKYMVERVYGRTGSMTSPTFPDLSIELDPVFDIELTPEERDVYKVKETPAKYYAAAKESATPQRPSLGGGASK